MTAAAMPTPPATATTPATTSATAGTNSGLLWTVYVDAVSNGSINFDGCDSFFSSVVSSKQSGAMHYTLMRVCWDPTAAGDSCNALPDSMSDALWLGMRGGPTDVAALVGSVYAGAGPGLAATVAPLVLAPGGGGNGGGSGSPASPATHTAGALAGGIIGAAIGSALLTGLIMRRRNAVIAASPMK